MNELCNGILQHFSIDPKAFHIGDVFMFYLGTNIYEPAILKEFDNDTDTLTFMALRGTLTVTISGGNFWVEYPKEGGTVTVMGDFRKMETSYANSHHFGKENYD